MTPLFVTQMKLKESGNTQRTIFRKMAGTQLSQFEGHFAVIMWGSQAKGNVYQMFFDL